MSTIGAAVARPSNPVVETAPAPYIHQSVEKDVNSIVTQHKTPKDKVKAREMLLEILNDRLRQNTNDAFGIVDISLYSCATECMEFECNLAWVDRTPVNSMTHTQEPYLPDSDAVLLCLPDEISAVPPPTYPSSFNDYLPQPFVCSIGDFRFNMWSPSPFHLPLRNLLRRYFALDSRLPTLMAFLTAWLRSRNVADSVMSDHCFALLFISFLQRHYGLSSFQWPVDVLPVQTNSSVVHWPKRSIEAFPVEVNAVHQTFDLRTSPSPLYSSHALRSTSMGWMLYSFFRFWFDSSPLTHTISIHKPWTQRRRKWTRKNGTIKSPPPNPNDSLYWDDAYLVVQDPFFTSHNHAQTVTKDSWKTFLAACRTSGAFMAATAPVHTIFGPSGAAFTLGSVYEARSYHLTIAEPIFTLHQSQAPNAKVLTARRLVIQSLSTLITTQFGAGFSVDCFGSTKYGVDSNTSDLDIIIIDHNRPLGNPPYLPTPKEGVYNMNKLAKMLRKAGFTRVHAIARATVPIVKFYDNRNRLNIDINCNNLLGTCNTELMRQYCEAWKPLRHMIFFIKKWAKSWSLNDPSGSIGPCSFSSYCLSLMVIAFLQIKGVLPNLQSSASGYVDLNLSGFWMKLKKDGSYLWSDTRFDTSLGWRGAPMSLHSGILGWLRFFGTDMPFERHLLDIRVGNLVQRRLEFNTKIPSTIDNMANSKASGRVDPTIGEIVAGVDALCTEDPMIEGDEAEDGDVEEEDADVQVVGDISSTPQLEPGQPTEYLVAVDEQPVEWTKSRFVVVDPFIRNKNCANACIDRVQLRFQQECQRALGLLQGGASVLELLGDGQPLFAGADGEPYRTPRGKPRADKPQASNESGIRNAKGQLNAGPSGKGPPRGALPTFQGPDSVP